jgi:hypothetical protein
MYSSKSFCNVDALISNVPGEISSVGELSTYGQTFTRDLGVYVDHDRPGYTLMNFVSSSDVTGPATMNFQLVTQAIAISHLIINKGQTTTGEIFSDELLSDLFTFGLTNDARNFTLGPMNAHDGKWFPDWVKWTSDLLVEDNENTVWFTINGFITQYTDFNITVVTPLDNLDNFFTSGANVENLISAITVPQTMDRIQQFKGGNPETIIRSDIYDYVDPINSAHRVPVNWPVLIYGPSGNNIDAIKDALVDWILAHSSHNRTEWTVIFPDIFKRTEFVIVPHWHKYGIPNMTLQQGIYSPMSRPVNALAFIKQIVVGYNSAHIDANAVVLGHPYRSLAVSAIGSAENRDDLFGIDEVFTDYINVTTSSIEFNRMNPETQAWVLMLSEMIIVAETMTEFSTVPQGMMKMQRSEIWYVVKTYQNIQYLVASKRSVYDKLGLDYNSP